MTSSNKLKMGKVAHFHGDGEGVGSLPGDVEDGEVDVDLPPDRLPTLRREEAQLPRPDAAAGPLSRAQEQEGVVGAEDGGGDGHQLHLLPPEAPAGLPHAHRPRPLGKSQTLIDGLRLMSL